MSARLHRRQLMVVLALALQTALIFVLVGVEARIVAGGTPVVLRVEPVDPTDATRGDYLAFRLRDLSTFSPWSVSLIRAFVGERVYVPLVRSGGYWTAAYRAVSAARPSDGVPYLAGTIVGVRQPKDSSLLQRPTIEVRYGIEQVFVPQGAANAATLWRARNSTYLCVLVGADGHAVAQGLIVNGRRLR